MSDVVTPEDRLATGNEPIVISFLRDGDSLFQTPDHDPHGTPSAREVHCQTGCDNPDCHERGLVPSPALEDRDGVVTGDLHPLVCSEECANKVQ